jgi:hypothetical protein
VAASVPDSTSANAPIATSSPNGSVSVLVAGLPAPSPSTTPSHIVMVPRPAAGARHVKDHSVSPGRVLSDARMALPRAWKRLASKPVNVPASTLPRSSSTVTAIELKFERVDARPRSSRAIFTVIR